MKAIIPITTRIAQYSQVLIFTFFISTLYLSCEKLKQNDLLSASRSNEESLEKCGGTTNTPTLPPIQPCGAPMVSNFIAGQNNDIGSVTIFNNADSLFVEVETTGKWWMDNISVYAGTLALMPVNANGNPKVGQFPYKQSFNPKQKNVRIGMPLSSLPSCFIVAVHADVKKISNGYVIQSETAWIQGNDLPGSNWAMAASYCKQSCISCIYTTQAASIMAEEKQICGQLLITNDADSIYVTYNMFDGWSLRKIQLYIGASMPVDNLNNPDYANFTIQRTFLDPASGQHRYSFPKTGLGSNVTIVARAETLRYVNGSVLFETAYGNGLPFVNATVWGWTIPYTIQFCG